VGHTTPLGGFPSYAPILFAAYISTPLILREYFANPPTPQPTNELEDDIYRATKLLIDWWGDEDPTEGQPR
jgi:hypothetical protein